MPNAAHYREAASRFRMLGENVGRQAGLVSGWPVAGHLGAGPVADTTPASLQGASRQLVAATGALARLARICDQRALVCDDYRRRVDEWERLNLVERFFVARPDPPFRWVSA